MTTYNKYDLNRDGRVNQSDLDYLQRAISNGNREDHMDLNGDGAINYRDIPALKQYLATTPPDPFPDDEYTRWIIKSYLNPKYKIKPKIFWRGYEPVYHKDVNTLGESVLEIQEKLKYYEPPSGQLPEDFDPNNYGNKDYLYAISSKGKDNWTFTTGNSSQSVNATFGLVSDVTQVPYGLRFATPYKISYFVPFFYLAHWHTKALDNFNYLLGRQFSQSDSNSVILENEPSHNYFNFNDSPYGLFPLVHFPLYDCSYAISYKAKGEYNFIQKLTKDKATGKYVESFSEVMDLDDFYGFDCIVPLPEGIILYSNTTHKLLYFTPDNGIAPSQSNLSTFLIDYVPNVGSVFDFYELIDTEFFVGIPDADDIMYMFEKVVGTTSPSIFPSVNGFTIIADEEYYRVDFDLYLVDGIPIYIPKYGGFEESYAPDIKGNWKNHYNVLVQGTEVSIPKVTFLSDILSNSTATFLASFPSDWAENSRIAIDGSGIAFVSEQTVKNGHYYEFDVNYMNYFGLLPRSYKVPVNPENVDPVQLTNSYPHLKQGLLYFVPEGSDGSAYLCSANFRSNNQKAISASLVADNRMDKVKKVSGTYAPELTEAGLQLPIFVKRSSSFSYMYTYFPIKKR